MTPGTALAALLADLTEAFGKPGDQTALVLSEDASTGRVVLADPDLRLCRRLGLGAPWRARCRRREVPHGRALIVSCA
jgi:hypothetical protein